VPRYERVGSCCRHVCETASIQRGAEFVFRFVGRAPRKRKKNKTVVHPVEGRNQSSCCRRRSGDRAGREPWCRAKTASIVFAEPHRARCQPLSRRGGDARGQRTDRPSAASTRLGEVGMAPVIAPTHRAGHNQFPVAASIQALSTPLSMPGRSRWTRVHGNIRVRWVLFLRGLAQGGPGGCRSHERPHPRVGGPPRGNALSGQGQAAPNSRHSGVLRHDSVKDGTKVFECFCNPCCRRLIDDEFHARVGQRTW